VRKLHVGKASYPESGEYSDDSSKIVDNPASESDTAMVT